MGNPVVHFEIISAQSEQSQQFYAEQFGWQVNADNPIGYGAVDTGAGAESLRGGIANPYPGTSDSYVTFYIGVGDIEQTLEQLTAAGSSIAIPVIDLPGGAKMAQFIDPFGSRVGLLQSPV